MAEEKIPGPTPEADRVVTIKRFKPKSEEQHKANGTGGSFREPRIRLVAFDDIRLGAQRRYLIKNLIPRVGLTVVWGPPKSGKSFWTFDVAMHIALGWEYRGRRVHQGPVVYCAFEGQTGIEARVEAFRQRFLAKDSSRIPFYLEPLTLDLVGEHQDLIAVIGRQFADKPPVAVVLDTLNRSLRGSESSDEDMSLYIQAADAIREAFNCAVIIVHHCGIEGTRPRGHTSLTGAVDAQLSTKRDAVDSIITETEMMKDGPQGETIVSRLDVVEVGIDEDGDTITSCVIVPAEGIAGRPTKLTGPNKIAFDALQLAIDEAGEAPPITSRQNRTKRAVRSSLWGGYCERLQISKTDNPDSKRKAFKRAADKLQVIGKIGVWDEWVWIND